jgi:NADPH-dependent 2,4-dienoyl-CoA reductase/sulfur reductase-like enzyme
VDDLKPLLPEWVKAGADIIHASLGTHGSPAGITSAPVEYPPGFNVGRAKRIKEIVNVPVIGVGRFTDLILADEVIGRGEADLVAFGRQFLADPDFILKTREGRSEDVRKCIACNQGCIERLILGEGNIRCAINPETGQETLYPQGPAAVRRRVWVIGGGPAGLTAACEAARLGHQVDLFEKEKEWGGQLRYAGKPPFKNVYQEWGEWLAVQAKKMGVNLHPGVEVMEKMIQEGNPEALILAAGGEKIVPDIPGIDLPHVADAWQILMGEVTPKKNALVIGGGLIGMETADFLSQKGTHVTLVEVLKRSPVLKITSHGYMLHTRLREAGCKLIFDTKVKRIESSSVAIVSQDTEEVLSPIDQVVVAVGLKPVTGLKDFLEKRGMRTLVVGDAVLPRRIIEATEEGAKAAWNL